MSNLFTSSIELLKRHQAPNGAFVACPTFPTYNYCWFRDGTYIAYALDLVGEHACAERFYHWAFEQIGAREFQIERAIAAAAVGQPNACDLLDTRYALDGRTGDEEWPNFQLDGFGTLLWGAAQHLELRAVRLPPAWRAPVDLLARYISALWRLPCYDCWEEFGDQVHVATLAALYGGLNSAAELTGCVAYADTAADIRAFVLAEGVRDGRLCKFIGNCAVDASLIHVSTPYRLLDPDQAVMWTTVAQIERDLRKGGGVYRYAEDSYYGGGQWVLLTAYLGWFYTEVGEIERAQALLAWVEQQANAAGELPEQVAGDLNYPDQLPVWNERWGTSAQPLLWSHAAYITLSVMLKQYVLELQSIQHRAGLAETSNQAA
jgi:GH15 family glucan-1,4-alpha-glucosidase